MLKTRWPAVPIEDLCTRVTSGGTPSRSNPAYYDGGTIPWIKTGELRGWYVDDIAERITPAAVRESSAKMFPPETVLLAMYGDGKTMGSVGLIRTPAATNQACCAMLADPQKCDPKFLMYSLVYFKPAILKLAISGAQRNLNGKSIRQFAIGAPPVKVQQRIASILSAYDDLIESNTRRIEILEEMARRIYEEWFVRFRFPGHEGVRMVESELGLVPEGWGVTALRQLAEVNARSVRRGAGPTEIRYVDISSVSTGSIDNKERMLFADAPGRARRVVRDGDVIWACVRPNRKSFALVLGPEPNLLVSTGFAVLSPVAAPSSFVYQCVTTDDFVSHLVNRAKGAAYPAVGAEDFENAKVLKPASDLVKAFDRIAEPMMRLVAMLQLKNENLRATRDLLLPGLISGELDVSAMREPEALVA